MLANLPPSSRDAVARALIEHIIPTLAAAIEDSADDLAVETYTASATVFDVERCANDLLHALADLLALAPAPMRGTRDLLRFHQLQHAEYSAAYFRVKLPNATPPPARTAGAGVAPAPRPLAEIKRGCDETRQRTRAGLQFVPVLPNADQQRIASERAQLARQREEDLKLDDQQREESRQDAKDERDLKPGKRGIAGEQLCARPGCKNWFAPRRKGQKFCSPKCRHTTHSLDTRRRKQALRQAAQS